MAAMNITENTLKYHNRNIYSKLGVVNRKELVEISNIQIPAKAQNEIKAYRCIIIGTLFVCIEIARCLNDIGLEKGYKITEGYIGLFFDVNNSFACAVGNVERITVYGVAVFAGNGVALIENAYRLAAVFVGEVHSTAAEFVCACAV